MFCAITVSEEYFFEDNEMKIFFLYLIVAVTMLVSSCQRQAKPETNFLRDFNMGEIVKKMNVAGLKRKYSMGGTGTSNRKITERRSSYYLEYDIEEQVGERFDEAVFFDELKVEVEKRLKDSGIYTSGGGSSAKSFNHSYSKDGNRCRLDIVGARIEANKYMSWYVIR